MSQPPWPLFSPSEIASLTSPPARPRARRPARAAASEPPPSAVPIIALCHLGWDWVWQRPQQFLSRFARTHPVLFVETHCSEVSATRVDLRPAEGHANVTILQMHLPAARWADGDYIDAERRRALRATLAGELRGRFDRPLLWFNDPMAVVAFAGHLGERAIVYDCMDELSQFKGAPPVLVERERDLLRRADVVFCGGQRMRQKRLPLNSNCHFFGTGVDVAHFGRARTNALPVAPEIAAFGPGPVLGYFGVIDERIDYDLLAHIADARPDWHIAMVGPTAKVDPATFPRRPNLHWHGGQPYARLPEFAKGFSVAVMPFALNAATEFINPTKALEYMAAGRPVVSTALAEVRLNFGRVARIADSADEFIEYCAREISRPSWLRISRGLELAAANTWEAIVARMEEHIARVLAPADTAPRAAARTLPATGLSNLAYV